MSKAFDQLSGICKGMLADGEVNDAEAQYFRDWLKLYSRPEAGWALDLVVERVKAIFEDGIVTDEERRDLKAIMQKITGDDDGPASIEPRSSVLPLDDPPPVTIDFEGRLYSITGRFAYGTRNKVAEAIKDRGGELQEGMPTRETHFLVIGVFVSRDWIETNYGRKIERAVELRAGGAAIQIVSEDHWRKFLT